MYYDVNLAIYIYLRLNICKDNISSQRENSDNCSLTTVSNTAAIFQTEISLEWWILETCQNCIRMFGICWVILQRFISRLHLTFLSFLMFRAGGQYSFIRPELEWIEWIITSSFMGKKSFKIINLKAEVNWDY